MQPAQHVIPRAVILPRKAERFIHIFVLIKNYTTFLYYFKFNVLCDKIFKRRNNKH